MSQIKGTEYESVVSPTLEEIETRKWADKITNQIMKGMM